MVREYPRNVRVVLQEQFGRERLPARNLADENRRLLLGEGNAIEEPHHVVRIHEFVAFRTELAAHHRLGLHRAMSWTRSRRRRVIVRIVSQGAITHPRALVQEVDHLRPFAKVGIDQLIGDGPRGNGAPQILASILETIRRTRGARIAVAGNPHSTAGRRCCPGKAHTCRREGRYGQTGCLPRCGGR